mmetsp:Transcript_13839/g.19369  ORF Transcript_13839/g.19369 Transcript_13839/m.19369 type:complete len:208 (+) Transcript_13839:656-1279(+)
MRIGPYGNSKGTSQAKVRQLELSLAINEQVGRFQVSVEDSVVVTIGHSCQQLVEEAFQNGHVQSGIANIQILFQILIEKFKDKREFSFGVDYIVETNDVGMLKFFEERNFANGRGGDTFIFRFQTDLFEGDDFSGHTILRFVHDTVRALADLFHFLIPFHFGEGGCCCDFSSLTTPGNQLFLRLFTRTNYLDVQLINYAMSVKFNKF